VDDTSFSSLVFGKNLFTVRAMQNYRFYNDTEQKAVSTSFTGINFYGTLQLKPDKYRDNSTSNMNRCSNSVMVNSVTVVS